MLILANFDLVFSQVNNYNQMKAGSLFYSPGKNYRWPVKTVSFREFSVRSLWRISHLILAQLLLFRTIFFILYIPTKSFKVKNWNKSKIKSSTSFYNSAYRWPNLFFFSTALILYHELRKLFHTVANLTIAPD